MSSILKALKKLESETPEKESKQFVWPQPVDAKAAFNSSLQDKFSHKFLTYKVALVFFFLTTLILLIFISYSAYIHKKTEPGVYNPTINEREIQAKKTTVAKEKKIETTVDGNTLVKNDKKTLFEKEGRQGDMPPQKEMADHILPPSSIDKKPLEESQVKEEALIEPEKRTAPGWLTLQGISWSAIPSRRMAVINSIIAREGKTIDGARIVRIDKKYVVIEKNGEELMLTFD